MLVSATSGDSLSYIYNCACACSVHVHACDMHGACDMVHVGMMVM